VNAKIEVCRKITDVGSEKTRTLIYFITVDGVSDTISGTNWRTSASASQLMKSVKKHLSAVLRSFTAESAIWLI
jgi:hypothetical protein